MQLISYLNFNGQCETAFKFYEKALGGKISFMSTFAGTPCESQAPAEWRNKIMHATLNVGDAILMGSDGMPGQFEAAKGITVAIVLEDPVEAERIFNALAQNGTVQMPIKSTFWAERFGTLVDQFGTPWMVNCGEKKQ